MYKSTRPNPRSITVSEARQAFADVVNRVAYGNERITVERHGRALVAIVPISDLDRLEEMAPGRQASASKAVPRP
jgi:prevent-host-death family protein